YYQAIEFAIANQLESVEAGAQGSHKIARGYLAQPTYSAHWVRDAGFRDAISQFLRDERRYVEQDMEWVESHTPFRTNLDLERFQDRLKLDQVPDETPAGKTPT
nr:GNAT family N-acetyltransferase [Pseudomonadales bacterium]